MQKILTTFLKGLLVLVPLWVTAYVIYFVFVKIDGLLRFSIPGLGILVTILFIMLVGTLASNIFFARILDYLEKVFTRLPVVKLLYFSIKDLIGAFVGEKKSFTRPVMITLDPAQDIRILGFVTAEGMDLPGVQTHLAVYLPQSYNFGGFLILVPRERVTPLATGDSAKLMAFIMSGGVAKGQA
jgi:uncharacterized membrane protein